MVAGRVKPSTKAVLKSLGQPNDARAIDRLAEIYECLADKIVGSAEQRAPSVTA